MGWTERLQKQTSGDAACAEAVEEMLLRLRWDDTDDRARAKLSQIVARIWNGLEGVDLTGKPPLPSALWLHDASITDSVACHSEQHVEAGGEVQETVDPLEHTADKAFTEDEAANGSEDDIGDASVCHSERHVEAGHEVQETVDHLELTADNACTEDKAANGSEDDTRDVSANISVAIGSNAVRDLPTVVSAPAVRTQGKGKGKGKGGFRTVAVGVVEATNAMDAGLQTTLDELPVELRRRMDALTTNRVGARRVKLPWTLKAKQRKAVHLWAEMHGLEHRSFGYRGKRRLHLIVPSADGEDLCEEEDWEGED